MNLVSPLQARNAIYALRFRGVLTTAIEAVRAMKLQDSLPTPQPPSPSVNSGSTARRKGAPRAAQSKGRSVSPGERKKGGRVITERGGEEEEEDLERKGCGGAGTRLGVDLSNVPLSSLCVFLW